MMDKVLNTPMNYLLQVNSKHSKRTSIDLEQIILLQIFCQYRYDLYICFDDHVFNKLPDISFFVFCIRIQNNKWELWSHTAEIQYHIYLNKTFLSASFPSYTRACQYNCARIQSKVSLRSVHLLSQCIAWLLSGICQYKFCAQNFPFLLGLGKDLLPTTGLSAQYLKQKRKSSIF